MNFSSASSHLRQIKKAYTHAMIYSLLESLIAVKTTYSGEAPLTLKVDLDDSGYVFMDDIHASDAVIKHLNQTTSAHEEGFFNYIELWITQAAQMKLLDVDDTIAIEDGNIIVNLRHVKPTAYPAELVALF